MPSIISYQTIIYFQHNRAVENEWDDAIEHLIEHHVLVRSEGYNAIKPVKRAPNLLLNLQQLLRKLKRGATGSEKEKLRNLFLHRRMASHLQNKNLLPRLF